MLSKSAFNALLKTLEEPPEHVKFILATTEPEKVLPTILSRCQRYDFRNIPTREITRHLADICGREKIKADEDALLLVAKAGAGSMRDALSLLDRLLSIGEKHLTAEMVEQLLGLPKTQVLFELADALGAGDVKATLSQADAIVTGGLSVDALIASLTDHLRNLLILRTCGPDSTLVEVPGLSINDLLTQANRFDAITLTQDITILEELRRNIRQSQAGRALLDATLVRMALADQFASIGELLTRLDGGGADSTPRTTPPARSAASAAQKKNLEPPARVTSAPPAPVLASQPAPAAVALASDATDSVEEDDDDDLPQPGRVWTGPSLATLLKNEQTKAAPAPVAALDTSIVNVESVDPTDLPAVWQAALNLLAVHGPMLSSLLSPGRLVAIDEGRAIVRYAQNHDTFVKILERNGKKDLVREKLSEVLGRTVGVRFEVDVEAPTEPGTIATPAERQSIAHRPAAKSATSPPPPQPVAPAAPVIKLTPELIDSLRNEPLVKALMDHMGAQIVKVE
jgi:DNA polymerase-3 subunit gamma/tau